MPENKDSMGGGGGDAPPPGVAQRVVQAAGGNNPEPPHGNDGAPGSDKPLSKKSLWYEIRLVDTINCIVGIGMLVVAAAAYRIASDTSDLKHAVASLQQSADTAQSAQQAFMIPIGIDFERLKSREINGGKVRWLMHVNWDNSGTTPTRNLVVNTDCIATKADVYDPYNVPTDKQWIKARTIRARMRSHFVFGPHQTNHAGFCAANSPDVVGKKSGITTHYYIAGSAEYRDIFNPKNVHITEYCFHLTQFRLAGGSDKDYSKLTALIGLCSTHNCEDEECGKDAGAEAARDLANPKQPLTFYWTSPD